MCLLRESGFQKKEALVLAHVNAHFLVNIRIVFRQGTQF
jgi:hypothetical protein